MTISNENAELVKNASIRAAICKLINASTEPVTREVFMLSKEIVKLKIDNLVLLKVLDAMVVGGMLHYIYLGRESTVGYLMGPNPNKKISTLNKHKTKEVRIAELEAKLKKMKASMTTVKLTKNSPGIKDSITMLNEVANLNNIKLSVLIKELVHLTKT